MQLYAGSSEDFIADSVQKHVAERLGDAFYDYYRFRASVSEFNSWKNSLTAFAAQLRYSGVRDNGVVLEMQLPQSSARLDALIFGRSLSGRKEAVLVELKQWSEAQPSDWDRCVETFVGGAERRMLHPCVQAHSYAQYLEDMHTAFHPSPSAISIAPCAWLHNMHPGLANALTDLRFEELLSNVPLFLNNDADKLAEFFSNHVGSGDGLSIMEKALTGRHAPSRKLLEETAAMVRGEQRYRLIDDQIMAYEAVLAAVRRGQKDKRAKAVVVVKGGPGTGKSVIALNLLGTLSKMNVHVQHATGSKAFTQNLWKVLGSRSKAQIRYFNSYGQTTGDEIEVLLADEAHRLRPSSNTRFTKAAARSDRSQIDELLDATRVSVFFIDDHQTIRPDEIGSTGLIHEAATRRGARYESIDLRTQFRCAGSEEYIDWIDQLLEIRKTGVRTFDSKAFTVSILDDPASLANWISERVADGFSARIMAGFCWPWSMPTEDGKLVEDIRIGEFAMPWNAKPDAKRLANGIPPSIYWATDPAGLGQVGCIYTAQGFEFDYAGVIVGPDLVIREGVWVGQPSASRDTAVKAKGGARFTDVVKNVYRVLLSRGMKGVALCILDDETRGYIKDKLE